MSEKSNTAICEDCMKIIGQPTFSQNRPFVLAWIRALRRVRRPVEGKGTEKRETHADKIWKVNRGEFTFGPNRWNESVGVVGRNRDSKQLLW